MLVTDEDRKEFAKCWGAFCLAMIVLMVYIGIIMQFNFDVYLVTGIGIALLIISFILFSCLLHLEEVRGIGTIRKSKKEMKIKKFEKKYYPAGAPRAPVSSVRQTELRGAPSKTVCQVCGATYETPINFCEKCGVKMIRSTQDTEKGYF